MRHRVDCPIPENVFVAARYGLDGKPLWPKPVVIGGATPGAFRAETRIEAFRVETGRVRATLFRGGTFTAPGAVRQYTAEITSDATVRLSDAAVSSPTRASGTRSPAPSSRRH
jgi:hypothetical protein